MHTFEPLHVVPFKQSAFERHPQTLAVVPIVPSPQKLLSPRAGQSALLAHSRHENLLGPESAQCVLPAIPAQPGSSKHPHTQTSNSAAHVWPFVLPTH